MKLTKNLKYILIASFVLIINRDIFAASSYQVAPGTPQVITEWTVQKTVTNSCTYSIFVPTNTSSEWTAFYTNPPGCTVACSSIDGGWGATYASSASWVSTPCNTNCARTMSQNYSHDCDNPAASCSGAACVGAQTWTVTWNEGGCTADDGKGTCTAWVAGVCTGTCVVADGKGGCTTACP